MVEPITALAWAGTAAFSVALGRLTKKNDAEVAEERVRRTPLHFIAVSGDAEINSLIETVKAGEPVFVNLKPLRVEPEVRARFIKKLATTAEDEHLELSEVSNELLLLTDGRQLLRIRTLKELEKAYKSSLVDDALSSVVGS